MIKELSKSYSNVEYLDIRDLFINQLTTKKPSGYLTKNTTSVIFDKFIYAKPEDIDACAEKRGLHFTLDGVHLNTKGAQIVADSFFTTVQKYLEEKKPN